jgi:hypothetical protein
MRARVIRLAKAGSNDFRVRSGFVLARSGSMPELNCPRPVSARAIPLAAAVRADYLLHRRRRRRSHGICMAQTGNVSYS